MYDTQQKQKCNYEFYWSYLKYSTRIISKKTTRNEWYRGSAEVFQNFPVAVIGEHSFFSLETGDTNH